MGKTFSTGSLTNAIWQDASNNIGIGGAASSSYKFQVTGTTNLTAALTGTSATFSGLISVNIGGNGVNLVGSTGNNVYYSTDQSVNNGGKRWRFGHTGAVGGFSSWDVYNQTDNITAFSLASTGAATFSSSVNLGSISNSGDTSLLNIKQSSTAYNNGIYIERGSERNGYFMYIGGALDALTFRRNYFGTQSDVMSLTRNGNVGIGVTNPTNALQVQGNVYSTDTVLGRNLQPFAFAGPVAGSPTGAGIPVGYSSMNISTLCDGNWRPIMTNINDVKGYFWVTLGDAASKDTGQWFMAMTSPAYGVYNFGNINYQDNGWNTGGFDFSYDTSGGSFRLLVRCTSYYSSGATAYGTIYFLRLE